MLFAAAFLIFVVAGIFFAATIIDQKTKLVAVAGGSYREGILGQPSFLNPILVNGNETDRDLTQLLFSNVPDLAQSFKVSTDGKIWTVRLKDNIVWDDGKSITSDDVIFTVETIQNPDSRSSLLPIWAGVRVERVSEREFTFILPQPYAFFENNLQELRPIPKHMFGLLPAANIRLSNYNLEPVGSGPFKFDSFRKRNDGFITQYTLRRSETFFGTKPYLNEIIFKFYEDENALLAALNISVIDGAGGLQAASEERISFSHKTFEIRMPRYYALFFNTYASPALADKNVRIALSGAVDKEALVKNVFKGYALSVAGPMVPGMEGYAPQAYPQNQFSYEKANQVLDLAGWQRGDDGIRSKNLGLPVKNPVPGGPKTAPTRLEFSLVVPKTQFLVDTATMIKEEWEKIGVTLNLITLDQQDIADTALRTRNYEMIIFGNVFGNNPDLFSFWHSSERFYPGLNLALYNNSVTDSLIESVRKDISKEARDIDFASAQSSIAGDVPAVFLFSPSYIYVTKAWLNGFNEHFIPLSSYRFQNIESWYVKTARVPR